MAACLTLGVLLINGCGSATWLRNGLIDPSQVGNFQHPVRLEIRDSMSILEEPAGIAGAEEPNAEDVVVHYEEPKIAPGDILRISIFELLLPGTSTDQQFQVRSSGFQTLPVIGPVKVAGLTARELELDLKEKLREGQILPDAQVQVSILRSAAMQFSALGQVPNPGNLPIPQPDYRLLTALAAVGGISPQLDTIYVIRGGAEEGGRLPKAGPEDRQADFPSTGPAEGPFPLMMSDVSDGAPAAPVASTRKAAASSGPAGGPGVNELEILEGRPRSQPAVPTYNPQTGQWEVTQTSSRPTGVAPGGPPVSTQGTTSTTSERATAGVPSSGPIEEQAVPPTEALEPMVRIIEIPVKPLLAGEPRYNIVIRPGDLIDVPPSAIGEYYMGGNIARPGVYSLSGRQITVKQAVVSAGGFGPLAWPSRADLIRRVNKSEEQIIQIDLDAIYAGKTPDFYLRPNDVVNVGTSPAATFLAVLRNAFRFSYGFGLVYDRNFADKEAFGAKEQVKNRRRIEAQQRGIPFSG